MSFKFKAVIVIVLLALLCVIGLFSGLVGVNEGQNWVYLQYPNGTVRIIDEPGLYVKGFGKTWKYPRFIEFRYNDDKDDGDRAKESIKVTYNDGGTAQVSTYIRLATPSIKAARIAFHQQFGGNKSNIKASIKSYMIDCLKSTAPLMSSSENQTARKTEFRQIVEGQLKEGTYKMKKKTVVKKDTTDTTGQEITIFKTEVVLDKDGMPIVVSESPIVADFGMTVIQFSVTGTDYDPETRKQFAAKKASFLLTEQAKADREKAVQERLMIIERGLKNKADATAKANVIKEKAVIEAAQKAEVALQTKIEAETKAAQLLSVAEITKKEKLTIANMKLEVAQINAKEAEQKKLAMIAEAQGKKEAIELSGAITELEQAKIDASVEKAIAVAQALAKIEVPSTVIIGGNGGEGNQADITQSLFNFRLMQGAGLLEQTKVDKKVVTRKIVREKK